MCAQRTTAKGSVKRNDDGNHVAAFANGLRAIEAFSSNHQLMTVADVAKRAGLSRAAARRYLLTLAETGYAHFDGKRFQLTSRVLRLGHAYISSVPLPQIAQPIVEELGHKTGESAAFAVLDGSTRITIIASSTPHRIVGILTRVGTHLPALSTSTGRVMISGKSDAAIEEILSSAVVQKLTYKTKTSTAQIREEIRSIRKNGYGLSDEEIELGLRVIAVPVRNAAGAVLGSLCVSTYSGRYELHQLKRKFLGALLSACERLKALI